MTELHNLTHATDYRVIAITGLAPYQPYTGGMTIQQRVLLALGLAAGLGVLAYQWGRSPAPVAGPKPPAIDRAAPAGPLSVDDLVVSLPGDPFAPLALDDTMPATAAAELSGDALAFSPKPLMERIDALKDAALAGSARAACHLLVESLVCRGQAQSRKQRSDMLNSLEHGRVLGGEDLLIDMLASTSEEIDSAADRCAGFSPEVLADVDDSLRAALPRMSTRQKVILAMTNGSGGINRLRVEMDGSGGITSVGSGSAEIYPQFLADYTEGFLREGVLMGDPLALEGMVIVHLPAMVPWLTMNTQLARPDPYRFAGYALVLRQVAGDEAVDPLVSSILGNVLSTMSAAQRARLDAAVDSEVRRWRGLGQATASATPPARQATPEELCAN